MEIYQNKFGYIGYITYLYTVNTITTTTTTTKINQSGGCANTFNKKMQKMTRKNYPRNLNEFVAQLETPKITFFRKIRKRINVSVTMIDRWCNFDASTQNEEYLRALSEETGIPADNLFKRFDDENPA